MAQLSLLLSVSYLVNVERTQLSLGFLLLILGFLLLILGFLFLLPPPYTGLPLPYIILDSMSGTNKQDLNSLWPPFVIQVRSQQLPGTITHLRVRVQVQSTCATKLWSVLYCYRVILYVTKLLSRFIYESEGTSHDLVSWWSSKISEDRFSAVSKAEEAVKSNSKWSC